MAKKKKELSENTKYWIDKGIDLEKRRVMIDEEIEESSIGLIIRGLMEMVDLDDKSPIDIHVSSYGGSVYEGLMLCDEIEDLIESGIVVRTHAKGKIMSMAVIIYLMGQERYSKQRVTFMAHSLSSGTEGKVFEQKIDVAEAIRLNNELLDILGEKTTKTRKWWEKEIEFKDRYYNKKQAEKMGIVAE